MTGGGMSNDYDGAVPLLRGHPPAASAAAKMDHHRKISAHYRAGRGP
ncbi:hypothetical protein SsS58_05127 [Streptomyces scabiei]|uniref:Uncharacterized protein n=1 Tax=Streptomyces scabiei TaxID=1930 RepID=A0A100JS74_STRSC|nr:hypothetical protein SsS58_05127 [Streptomyces scabiei]